MVASQARPPRDRLCHTVCIQIASLRLNTEAHSKDIVVAADTVVIKGTEFFAECSLSLHFKDVLLSFKSQPNAWSLSRRRIYS